MAASVNRVVARREPHPGPGAASHAERHAGLLPPHRGQHAPQGRVGTVGGQGELLHDDASSASQAENCAQYLAKGRPGRRSTAASSGASGRRRTATSAQAVEIVADSVQFLGGRGDGEGAAAAATSPLTRPRRPPATSPRPRPTTTSRSRRPREWLRRRNPASGRAPGRPGDAARAATSARTRWTRWTTRTPTSSGATSRRGARIRNGRITGACRRHQRQVAAAVKRAREMALLPYVQGS